MAAGDYHPESGAFSNWTRLKSGAANCPRRHVCRRGQVRCAVSLGI